MLSNFEKKLDEDAAAARKKAIDDAKPLNEKLANTISTAKESAVQSASSRPRQVVATPRQKKTAVKRSIGDGL